MKKAVTNRELFEVSCPLCAQFSSAQQTLYTSNLPSPISAQTFSARRLPDKIHYQYVRCPHDSLVYATPRYPQHVVTELYRKSEVTYQSEIPLLQRYYLRLLQPVLSKLKQNARIVEVGSGSGFLIQTLLDEGFTEVYGVEPSEKAVQAAPKKLRQHLINDVFNPKLFQKHSLDFIFLFQTFDHLSDPNEFLDCCYELLKPGGYLFSLHHDVDTWQRKLLGTSHPIIDIEHPVLYSRRTSIAMFQKHGFLVSKISSPASEVSLAHMAWLLPLPNKLKLLLSAQPALRNVSISLRLGNLGITVQKPSVSVEGININNLSIDQKALRLKLLTTLYKAKLAHIGSCLSCIDIIWAVYQHKHRQDLFVLSNGHAGYAWYTVLNKLKLLSDKTYSSLDVHPHRGMSKHITVSTGSLGQGLPIALGLALADPRRKIYCLISDGECTEGSIWEALRLMVSKNVTNLIPIVSANGWSAYDRMDTVQLFNQLQGMGLSVRRVNGHDLSELSLSLAEVDSMGHPAVLFCDTYSQQLPFLEGLTAHYASLNEQNMKEVKKIFS